MTADRRLPVRFPLALLLLVLLRSRAFALTYDVDRFDDDASLAAQACTAAANDCSLRGAIIKANGTAGVADDINLPDGTYTLTIAGTGEDSAATGDLDISDSLAIHGTSQAGTIIDGGLLDRVIQTDPTGAGTITVNIQELTIQHGQSPAISSKNAEGGGIRNGGTPLGPSHPAGTLHLFDVTVDSNSSEKFGGGISNEGTMTILNCLITNNASGFLAGGAGIVQDDLGSLSINGTTLRGNDANKNGSMFGGGGGISIGFFSSVASPVVSFEASTISGNTALVGGGLQRIRGIVTMRNSTISGNIASQTSGFGGGGIGDVNGFTNGLMPTMLLKSCTVTNNAAGMTDGGGGINVGGGGIRLANTIVAGNRGGGTPPDFADGTPSDIIGTLVSKGYNLIGKATGYTVDVSSDTTGDINGVTVANLHLDPNLTHVGGPPTELHVLLAGSPAIDAGNPATPLDPFGCANTDQRASTRPRDGDGNGSEICDIGAYEVFDPFPSPTPTTTPGVGATVTPTPTPTIIATPNPGGENCFNCIDDDGDGLIDRDDNPGCDQPFDGAGAGLGDPAAGKRLVKCAGAIQKAGAKFASKRLGRLRKCLDAAFACTQLKGGNIKCINKATAACDKAFQGSVGDEAKLTATITKACGPDKVTSNALTNENGLGWGGHKYRCERVGASEVVDVGTLAACVALEQACRVDGVIGAEVPRAAELLSIAGFSGNNLCPESTDLAAGLDGGLSDPKRAKLAVKCQATIGKAGAKLVNAEVKTVPKCANAVLACLEVGKDGCAPKSRTTCTKIQKKIDALAGKLDAAITKACVTSGLTASEALDLGGVNLARLAPLCSSAALPLTTVADATTCVTKLHQCRAHQLLENQLPRLRELLGIGQLTIP